MIELLVHTLKNKITETQTHWNAQTQKLPTSHKWRKIMYITLTNKLGEERSMQIGYS